MKNLQTYPGNVKCDSNRIYFYIYKVYGNDIYWFQFVFNPNYRFYGEITVVGNNEIVISE